MDADLKYRMKELEAKKWMKVGFIFEVLGMNKEIVEKSLKEHIDKLEKIKTSLVYKKDFSLVEKVEKPMKGIEFAYSQIVETEVMVQDLKTLMVITISYGPSSIEILKPNTMNISAGEIQDVANMTSGVIHQIASAGLGGIVATPKK